MTEHGGTIGRDFLALNPRHLAIFRGAHVVRLGDAQFALPVLQQTFVDACWN